MGSDIPSLPTDDQEMEHSPLGMDFPCRVRSGVSPQSKPLRLNKAYGKAAASDYEAHEIHFFQLDGRHHVSRNAKYSKCLNLGHFLAGAGRHHSEDVDLIQVGFRDRDEIIGDNGNINKSWSCMAGLQQTIGK